ncbi:mercuric reductase [Mesorhizobium sp. M00.F.Ca.ET.186.01.1.1]|nr:mercuric reductase [bacterium M00.F.Ca.ET.205.01.1.1]TGU49256.1 mercuric reductase [bacterium M00.F.Ca.ET.152.01.1.1]TGV32997.1 mercuric reductase [Mesorhizobium sp. M00.F.Ca.ET.186.01.1.1]TGZ40235.1 mercuric reductase [bacterium M00.F.Ca.ET.162.01.1.1]
MARRRTKAASFPVDHNDVELIRSGHPPRWKNPEPNGPYNLVVIGAGPAGLTAAREAAALGAKVALIERGLIGGARVNVGCIPSKSLTRTARLYADMRDAESFGGDTPDHLHVDFERAMMRMRQIRQRISRADSAATLVAEGIELYFGEARFAGQDTVTVAGRTLQFRKALVATGARPALPEVPGLAEAGYLSNETLFDLTKCPQRLLVIGGGPLGCETAQAFCLLGAKVILAQREPMFLPGEERDAAQILSDALAREGVEVRLNTEVVAVRRDGGKKLADLLRDDDTTTISVDEIVTGIGRSPNVDGLGLEAAGVAYDAAGIKVDDFLKTTNSRIYAAGDVCLAYKYTHTAEASARIVVQNALFLGRKRLSELVIPWCTYTDPEIAHVGLYPAAARQNGIPVKTYTVLMHDVARAVMDGEEEGFVKIHVREGSDTILGATVVASHAGEMINAVSLAIKSGMGLQALADVIHPFPTQAQGIKMAGDAYRRTQFTSSWRQATTRWLARSRR